MRSNDPGISRFPVRSPSAKLMFASILPQGLRPGMTIYRPSIEVEFFELAVIGLDVTHRAGDRAHHHGLGLYDILAELDARQQRTGRNPGCCEPAVAPPPVLAARNHASTLDPHLAA